MMVIISARDEVLQKNVLIDDDITIQAGSTFSYTFYQSERYSMPQGSSVTAVTVDDSSFSSGSITLPKSDLQQVYEPLIVFRQGWSDFTQVPGSNDLIMQVPGMPPLVSNFFGAKIHLWRVSSSSFVDEYFTFAGSGSDVWSVLIPSSSGFTLPVGSFVHESSHLPGDLTPTAFFQIWFPQRSVQFP